MTTLAPTTPVPTTLTPTTVVPVVGLFGAGYVAVAFPSGSSAGGVLDPDGVVGLKVLSTATEVVTDACWDSSGFVYFAYKQGANVRLGKWDGQDALATAEWDVPIASMDSTDGRAMITWHEGWIYIWVHNVNTESNLPQIYRVWDETGGIEGGGPWHAPDRTPSAAVEAANPGGANFGYYPGIRVTDSRVFLLGMDAAVENVYLEIVNLATKAQVADITLQAEASPDETYPRGIDVDPVNEHVFVTWADFNDVASRDEPNRASYDLDGSLRWSNTSYVSGYDFIGGVAYDIGNDQLYIAGGTDGFGVSNESITKASSSTGARISGSEEPNPGAVGLNIQMNALDYGVFVSNGGTIFRYQSSIADPEEWSTVLASTSRVMVSDYVFSSFSGSTQQSTTPVPTSLAPTTTAPTTPAPTTVAPTAAPTTQGPTTIAPTGGPTTASPTTLPEPTFPPVATEPATTLAPTAVPTTLGPTTLAPSTLTPTTELDNLVGDLISCSITHEASLDRMEILAWAHDAGLNLRDEPLDLDACILDLVDEAGARVRVTAVAAAEGDQYARFVITQARLYSEHLYVLEITLVIDGGATLGPAPKGLPVN